VTRARFVVVELALVALVVSLGSCSCDGDHIAELTTSNRVVERDYAGAVGEWSAAEIGARFSIGDGVRTGDASEARVSLVAGGTLRMAGDSLVRFLEQEGDRPMVEFESGELDLTAGPGGFEVVTGEGRATLIAGSVLEIRTGDEGRRFVVRVGAGVLHTRGGEEIALSEGAGVLVSVGEGQILASMGSADEPETPPELPPENTDDDPPITAPLVPTTYSVTIRGRHADVREGAEGRLRRSPAGQRQLSSGSELRIGRRSSAVLTSNDARTELGAWSSAVLGRDGSVLVLNRGTTTAEAGAQPIQIGVPGGHVVIGAGARATLHVDGDGKAVIRATRGTAEIVGEAGSQTVQLGLRGYLSDEGAARLDSGPARSALAITAGGSATIHDPSPPTAVDIVFGETSCAEAVVEVGESGELTGLARGLGHATILLRTGNHPYRVRCLDGGEVGEAVASGSLRVINDSATSPLPTTPPTSTVDADGRRYTVRYQTLLPELTFQWPDAPRASSYTLTVNGPRNRTMTRHGPRPTQTFSSGDIGHGNFRYRFEADGGRRSRDSVLRVAFDSASSSAFIAEPDNGTFAPGDRVRVQGGAVRRSTVTAHGRTLSLNGRFRFDEMVLVPADHDALTVRISHSSIGEHYYIRRARR